MIVDSAKAKEIALLFLKLTEQEITPLLMGRVISQIKKLMEVGYTAEEIEYATRTAIDRKPDIYSFGYISIAMDNILEKRKLDLQKKHSISNEVKPIIVNPITSDSEVQMHDETSERNKRKAERFGFQSRERKKSYFDLFEGQ